MPRLIPTINIKLINGSYCLQWSRKGRQFRLFCGIADLQKQGHILEACKASMLSAMSAGRFEWNDNYEAIKLKYLPGYKEMRDFSYHQVLDFSLSDLFKQFIEYKRKMLSESTVKIFWDPLEKLLDKNSSIEYRDVNAIKKMIAKYTPAKQQKIINTLSAMIEWHNANGMAFENVYEKIKIIKNDKKKKTKNTEIFNASEVRIILTEISNAYGASISGFCLFRAITGCRISEALGLKWSHISDDCSSLKFQESIVYASGQHFKKVGLKSQSERILNLNKDVKSLLISLKEIATCEYVFERNGTHIDKEWFDRYVWNGVSQKSGGTRKFKPAIVRQLFNEGKISTYAPFNSLRHFFVSECLKSGYSLLEISGWAGNSPEVAMKHYARLSQNKSSIPSVIQTN